MIERILKGGAGFLSAIMIKRGLGFAFVLVASRLLGPSEFGVLALGLSVMGIFRKVATFGLPSTIQRFLSGKGEEKGARLYGVILLVGGGVSVTIGILLYGTAWTTASVFSEPRLTRPLRILAAALVAGVGFAILRAVLQAQEKIKQIICVDSLCGVTKVGLLLPMFLWRKSASNAAWAVLGSFGASLAFTYHYVRRLAIYPVFDISRQDIQKVLSYSFPLVIVGFGHFLVQHADRLMLGWLTSSTEVGLYTVTSTLAMVMGILHGSFIAIFKPVTSEAYRNQERQQLRRAYQFVAKWGGTINGIGLLAFVGLGPWILQIVGNAYTGESVYYVLLLLSTMYFLRTWVGPTGALLQMSDGHRIEFTNTLIFITSNIILNYLLIIEYGLIGAAVATLVSGLLLNIIQLIEVKLIHGLTPFNAFNIGVLVSTVGCTLAVQVINIQALRALLSIGAIIVTVLVLLVTASDNEKDALKSILSRDTVVDA